MSGTGRVVVVGGSAGALGPLQCLCGGLSGDLPASILVVVHVPAAHPSNLARILDGAGPLPAVPGRHGDHLEPGRIYVAPCDHHLLVGPNATIELNREAPESLFRPSIDVLFRSAASGYGPRAIAVVLSGALYDGAEGAGAVGRAGGTVIVQDPDDAVVAGLPRRAMSAHPPDLVVSAAEMAAALCQVVGTGPARTGAGHGTT